MNKKQIDVLVKREFVVKVSKSWFRCLIKKVLDYEEITHSIELSLVITDERTIRNLNKLYRKQDKYTDVLAFSMVQDIHKKEEQPFIVAPDDVTYLGEVLISYPIAVKQALEQSHSVEKELALLTIHGILHLLGYDHEKDQERQMMRQREREILDSINLEKLHSGDLRGYKSKKS